MAELVLKDAVFKLQTLGSASSDTCSTAFVGYVTAATLSYSAELLEKTAFGDGTKRRIQGLKDWSLTIEFNDDFASTGIDEELFNHIGSTVGTSQIGYLHLKATTAKGSATNPRWAGKGMLESYPMGGTVGELAKKSITFQANGTLSRLVTSGL